MSQNHYWLDQYIIVLNTVNLQFIYFYKFVNKLLTNNFLTYIKHTQNMFKNYYLVFLHTIF